MLDEDKKVGAGASGAGVNGYVVDPSNAGFGAVLAAAGSLGGIDFTTSAACGPVKAFQNAWNNAGGTPTLAVDGGYGTDTASANGATSQANGDSGAVPGGLSSGFPNCGGGVQPPPVTPVTPVVPSSGMPNWLKILIYILIAGGVVAGSIWLYRYYGKRQLAGASERRRPRRRGKRKAKRR